MRSAEQCGDSPSGITPFHLDNRVDDFCVWSLWPRSASAFWREQQTGLSFPQRFVEMQQSCRPQNDDSTQKARRANEKRARTGNSAIGRAQVGRTLAAPIQDQKLMPDQHGFGNHTAETARLCQLNQSADRMN